MAEENPSVVDTQESQDASGVEPQAVEPESTNAAAKKLPWVQELMKKSAELDQLKRDRAEAEARAERDKAEAEQDYKKALGLEIKLREEAEAQYKAEIKKIQLDAEFSKAGLLDTRAIQLFDAGFNPDEMSAHAFVESIKADPVNAMYFDAGRQKQTPPRTRDGLPDTFDPSRDLEKWLKSSDPKKRERAIAHNREIYRKQLEKG